MNPFMKSAIERVKTLAAVPYARAVGDFQHISEDDFWAYQKERFGYIYRDAVQCIPYYIGREHDYPKGLDEQGGILDVLAQLPVLPKSAVKQDVNQFWRHPPLFLTREHTTGGTTGTPLRVRASLMERGYTEAILRQRYREIVGTPTPRILRLSGFLEKGTNDSMFLRIPGTKFAYLSIYELRVQRAGEVRRILADFKPNVLHGYASALHQLALLFGDQPVQSEQKWVVVSTSETLFDHQRVDIERNLNAIVLNEYGSQEGQHLVLECTEGSLHIHPGRGVVEILKPNEDVPAESGELGRVVVTGLVNRTMPLIRYDLGDSAISTGYAADCKCGLQWPTIGSVFGRTEDLVRTRDGRRIGILSHSTLKDWEGIAESQIIQEGFERFRYLIVPQNPTSFDAVGLEAHVREQLRNRIGGDAEVMFDYVDAVPRTAAGKIQAVMLHPDFRESLRARGEL